MSLQKQPDQVFTTAERIQQLNDIDRDVRKLLQNASAAIDVLTNINFNNDANKPAEGNPLDSRKAAYSSITSDYFALLSSIDVRLRRQVYALDEESIIPSVPNPKTEGAFAAASVANTRNPLDVGWLNSRTGHLDREKEAELWAEARQFVESNIGDSSPVEKQEKEQQ
ncbi:hypothetical protein KEM54_004065 [Ascosphaera aggregata]|nr:hypothetical protein KEM54_004065 [Ascosphaera aggregata]